MIGEYLVDIAHDHYLRIASSFLDGRPRSYWTSHWEVYQAANPGLYSANARRVFRGTTIKGYSLRTPVQSYSINSFSNFLLLFWPLALPILGPEILSSQSRA